MEILIQNDCNAMKNGLMQYLNAHEHLHTRTREHAKFQKYWMRCPGGVADTSLKIFRPKSMEIFSPKGL